jgi:hypothetical protein
VGRVAGRVSFWITYLVSLGISVFIPLGIPGFIPDADPEIAFFEKRDHLPPDTIGGIEVGLVVSAAVRISRVIAVLVTRRITVLVAHRIAVLVTFRIPVLITLCVTLCVTLRVSRVSRVIAALAGLYVSAVNTLHIAVRIVVSVVHFVPILPGQRSAPSPVIGFALPEITARDERGRAGLGRFITSSRLPKARSHRTRCTAPSHSRAARIANRPTETRTRNQRIRQNDGNFVEHGAGLRRNRAKILVNESHYLAAIGNRGAQCDEVDIILMEERESSLSAGLQCPAFTL